MSDDKPKRKDCAAYYNGQGWWKCPWCGHIKEPCGKDTGLGSYQQKDKQQ